eukprot:scaffold69_cov248-Pinguiococcus_pyrenoidosus.AAC.7
MDLADGDEIPEEEYNAVAQLLEQIRSDEVLCYGKIGLEILFMGVFRAIFVQKASLFSSDPLPTHRF